MTYVDIAEVARRIGVPSPEPEVYRRLLVNSFLHNTDDHLRNLAFLRKGGRWEIAPGYDLAPHKMARHVVAPAPKLGFFVLLCAQLLEEVRGLIFSYAA